MKTQYNIYMLLVTCLGLFFSSCSSDDNDNKLPLETSIELDQTEVKIKLTEVVDEEEVEAEAAVSAEDPNTASVKIVAGAGGYSAYPLDKQVATAAYDVERDAIIVTAKRTGFTKVMVFDRDMNVVQFPVMVYKTDKVVLENSIESLDLVIRAGQLQSSKVAITEGNGAYKATVDTEGVVEVEVNQNDELLVTPVMIEEEGVTKTAVVTVTDKSGFSTDLNISVKAEMNPYSQEEIDDIKALNEQRVFFDGDSSEGYDYSSEIIEGTLVLSASTSSRWGDKMIKFYLPEELEEGVVEGAQIEYRYFGTSWDMSSGKEEMKYCNIVEVSDEYIKGVFFVIGSSYQRESKVGYFVFNKPAQDTETPTE